MGQEQDFANRAALSRVVVISSSQKESRWTFSTPTIDPNERAAVMEKGAVWLEKWKTVHMPDSRADQLWRVW